MNRMVRAGLVVALLLAPAFAWAQAGEDGAGEPAAEGAASAEAEAAANPAPEEAQPPAAEEQPADEAEPSDGDDEADEDAYDVRVRDLEERVNQLKMRIYQSKRGSSGCKKRSCMAW